MTNILGLYQAYHKWLAENNHDCTLPNLGLNPNQLFFLSFAQVRLLSAESSRKGRNCCVSLHEVSFKLATCEMHVGY